LDFKAIQFPDDDWILVELVRTHQALLYVSVPGFKVSDAALGLFARQLQSVSNIAYAFGPVVLFVVTIAGRFQVKTVSPFPLCFDILGRLYPT
jgi:hypothetical protein